MSEFTASNGVPIRRVKAGYLSFTLKEQVELGTLTGISIPQEAALREYFEHEAQRPTIREAWKALPIGARFPGGPADPQDWVKINHTEFIVYGGNEAFRIRDERDLDRPLPEGWDFTERVLA